MSLDTPRSSILQKLFCAAAPSRSPLWRQKEAWKNSQVQQRYVGVELHGNPRQTCHKEEKGGKSSEKYKSERDSAYPSEDEHTHGIYCLNLG